MTLSEPETRIRELRYRMMIIDMLRIACRIFSYKELSERLDLSPPILSRYMRGHVLPSYGRARELYERLIDIMGMRRVLERQIEFDERGYFDNSVITSDISWIRLAANYAIHKFAGKRVTKVLTAATDGIPLATMIANLLDVNLVVAKKCREVGIKSFIEEIFIPGDSAIMVSLFLPKGAIKRRDSVLIVDDVVRTGDTIRALVSLVDKNKRKSYRKGEAVGPTIAGIYVPIAIGEDWKKNLADILETYDFETFVHVRPPRGRVRPKAGVEKVAVVG